MSSAEQVFRDHIASFNAHDVGSLMEGFASEAVWVTGQDTFRGTADLTALFEGAVSAFAPSLTITNLLVAGDSVAAEMIEHATVNGTAREYPIAAFYRLDSGRIVSVKIYREGSAVVD